MNPNELPRFRPRQSASGCSDVPCQAEEVALFRARLLRTEQGQWPDTGHLHDRRKDEMMKNRLLTLAILLAASFGGGAFSHWILLAGTNAQAESQPATAPAKVP